MFMEYIVNIIFYSIITCWIATFVVSHRLFYQFRKKYPDIAKEKIPHAFTSYATPEKILFFFKKENTFLLRKDAYIWRLRQQAKILSLFSICLPFALAIILLLIFFLLKFPN